MAAGTAYPVRVEADLESGLSRWLWLTKWVLAIPHYLILAALSVAFVVMTIGAFFAILLTGRYPRTIFDFNVGVLRWSWRVADYSFGVLGTDRYPPFTLRDVPDYPAHLDVQYPQRLSRGLALVKWWLLAIPHYLVLVFLAGSGVFAWTTGRIELSGGSLITLLVLIAAVALLFTGRYPRGLFDLILGLNRWVIRVAAYASLMTDEYPPFRLDLGGREPAATIAPPAGPAGEKTSRWSAGPATVVLVGSLAALLACGVLVAGAVVTWIDRTERDAAGFVNLPPRELRTDSYALVTEPIDTPVGRDSWLATSLFDDARLRVMPVDGRSALFLGIGRQQDVDRYLDGVAAATVTDIGDPEYTLATGGQPDRTPGTESFWVGSASGTGMIAVDWPVDSDPLKVVVMNLDATPGLDVRVDAGARLASLGMLSRALLIGGAIALASGLALIVVAITRARGRLETT